MFPDKLDFVNNWQFMAILTDFWLISGIYGLFWGIMRRRNISYSKVLEKLLRLSNFSPKENWMM